MKRLVLSVILVFGLTGPLRAAGFEEGSLAYHRGDHAEALRIWRPLAEQGDARAQYSLGLMYYRGEGVLPDLAEAAKWYRSAADRGDPDAQLNLGLMYALGEGVRKNYVQAYKWFALAYWAYGPGEFRLMAEKNRENAAAAMTPAQISRAERLVRAWKPKRR
ncbi:MAG: tetratricopeptide repeat protein [Kiloniellaceae bacterium]